ncbi:MAG: arginine deiminase family protein [Thermoplasmata archaeon]
MEGKIKAEWNTLRKVAMHKPGIEMFFGLLDPEASLYERAFSRYKARSEHSMLQSTLKEEFGVDVIRLDKTIADIAERNSEIREKLINLAAEILKFDGNASEVAEAQNQLKQNIDQYDTNHFIDILLLRPEVHLKSSTGASAVHMRITNSDPLSNLYFMRDQQATTDKGIFMSRLSKPQRRHEPEMTELLWNALNLPIAGRGSGNATIEGGDFIPMKDFALLGNGDRTNDEGVKQMLSYGLGFDEVAVVHQPLHPLIPGNQPDPMIDMHLDTYFNVASSTTVVGSGLLLKNAVVDIYLRESEGKYKKTGEKTNLHDYMKTKGFNIIWLSTIEQMAYSSNFLCIKDGTILAIDSSRILKAVVRDLEFKAGENPGRYGALLDEIKTEYSSFTQSGGVFPYKKEINENGIDAYALNLENLTGGYGGAHCMTAAIERN